MNPDMAHNSNYERREKLREKARRLREEAEALDNEAAKIVILVSNPRKTKAQLEKELEEEKSLRRKAESTNEALRRQIDPPDYSYFGLGDGPT